MLNLNKRQIVSIFVTILIILGTYLTGYADITPVSDRTLQVRDAIVAAAGVNSAADVTDAHLATITRLHFGDSNGNVGITSLKSGDFSGLSSLSYLQLFDNPLTTLPEGVFDGLSSLEYLGLGGNVYTITSLPEGVFDGLSSLIKLRLHGDFTSLPEDLFDSLSSLEELQLSFLTNITSLPDELFYGLSSLKYIAIYGGGFTSLPEDLLDGLSSLETFFSHGIITTLPEDFFNGLSSLTRINLSGGYITSLPTDLFDGLSSLTSLRISGKFTSISSDIFDGLSSLTSLNLFINGNSFPPHINLPAGIFDGLSSLTSLNLSYSRLTSLSSNIFDDLSSLTSLNLRSNNITDVSALEDLTNLTTLKLANNTISDYGPLRRLVAAIEAAGRSLDLDITIPELTVSERTPQVRDEIVRLARVNSASDVTDAHLAAITSLDLSSDSITSLKSGDFDGLTSLISLNLSDNRLSDISALSGLTSLTDLWMSRNRLSDISVLSGLTSLLYLHLGDNSLSDISALSGLTSLTNLSLRGNYSILDYGPLRTLIAAIEAAGRSLDLDITIPDKLFPISDRTPAVQEAILKAVQSNYPNVANYADITLEHLASVTALDLNNKGITTLQSGDFNRLPYLEKLYLKNNQLSSLPSDIFKSLPSLTSINLYNNDLSSLPDGIFEGLTSLTSLRLGRNAVDPLPITVSLERVRYSTRGFITPDSPDTYAEFSTFKIVVPTGTPFSFYDIPTTITNGSLGTLHALYQDASFQNLEISAGSVEGNTAVVSRNTGTTGAVTVDIKELPSPPLGHYGYVLVKSDDLPLTAIPSAWVAIPSVNAAPIFTEGTATTRSVAERTAAGVDIGTPLAAEDAENDTLTWTLSGTDATAFDIDSTTGQLKTKDTLDYETKNVYEVTVVVSDGSLENSIKVTIQVSDVAEAVANTAPKFVEVGPILRHISENTVAGVNIGAAVTADDQNPNDTLTYTLGGVDAASFDIDSTTGQLKTDASLDYETKRIYSVTVTVADDELSDTIAVIINIIDVNDTEKVMSAFIPVSDRTPEVRDAIVAAARVSSASDVTDAHLALIQKLDLRGKGIVSLKTGDFSGMSSLTNLNLFRNQLSSLPPGIFNGLTALTTLRLGGNAADPLPLIVSLQSIGAGEFKAVIPTGAPFDIVLLVNKSIGGRTTYLTTVTIPQGSIESAFFTVSGTSAKVSLGAMPVLPRGHHGYAFSQSTVCNRTDAVAEAITRAAGVADCRYVTEFDLATLTTLDLSGLSLTSLNTTDFADLGLLTSLDLSQNQLSSLPDGIFAGMTTLMSLQLGGNAVDPLPLPIALLKVGENQFKAVAPSGAPWTIHLPIVVLTGNVTTRSIRVTISQGNIESDPQTINRPPGTNAAVTVNIGTMPNLPATHSGYTLAKSDALPLEILKSINVAPVFTDGSTTTRSIPENTDAGINIDRVVAATDANKDTLTYTLGGTDAAAFDIVRTTGQLRTKAALDFETKNTYSVTLTVSDGLAEGTINVTINITDVDENSAPVFTEGASTTRIVAENTAAGEKIGTPVGATDADNDTLTYRLSGTDAAAFGIDTTTGQLKTSAALDYETKAVYSVSVTVSDGTDEATITVTINVVDATENSAPVFDEGSSASRSVPEDTGSGVQFGFPIAATDVDGNTLTYTLGGTDASSFSIDSTTGQLRTNGFFDYETKTTYTVTITVSDGTLTDTITVTINITDVEEAPDNSAPVFTAGTSTTRSVPEDTGSGVQFGSPIAATDADGNTLTYILGGTDAASFSIDSTNGQLRTSAALDYETKTSYTVTVSVSDGNGGTDSIEVTINVTDVPELTSTPVSERTPQVRDAIVAEVDGVHAAADVTDAHLTAITHLNLGSTGITSLKFGDFDGLTSLTDLNLSHNSLSDLSVLSGLTSLTDLNLSHNSLSDLSALSGLTSLTKLYLYGNPISDYGPLRRLIAAIEAAGRSLTLDRTIPEETSTPVSERTPQIRDAIVYAAGVNSASDVTDAHLAAITKLIPTYSGITSLKFGDFDGLTSLTELWMHDNSISDISALSGLTSLTKLVLGDNSISDISALSGLTSLTYLDLSFNSISDISALSLSGLTSLTYLGLGNNSISDLSALSLSGLTSLTELRLGNNSISDLSALSLAGLTSLTTLYLSNNSLSDLSALSGLTSLTELRLSDNSISDLSALAGLTSLTKLVLGFNSISDISALAGLTSLTDLSLYHNSVSDISALAGLTSLTFLHLWNNSVSDISALAGLTSLTTLYLSGNPISDYGPLRTLKAAIEAAGGSLWIDIRIPPAAPTQQLPVRTSLLPNFPNPFNPETWIPYELSKPSDVTLTIYNMRGVVVRTIALGHKSAGVYRSRPRVIHWDGRNSIGEKVAAGVYFYTLKAGEFSATRKMLIRK